MRINGAKRSLHIAIFDFRLGDPATVRRITGALKAKAAAGVDVKIAYDHRNAPKFGPGDDPAPHGTHVFLHGHFAGTSVKLQPVGWTEVHFEGIAGSKLMHNKYVIRDGHSVDAAVLMGSASRGPYGTSASPMSPVRQRRAMPRRIRTVAIPSAV